MESTKLTERKFAEIVATYMEKWIEPLREYARAHFKEWYENEVTYSMFVKWSEAKSRAHYLETNRYLDSEMGDSGRYERERAAQYSEVIHDVLLGAVSTETKGE